MQIGTIDSVWRYPVKGMRGEEVPHIYTAYTGLMGDRIYGVVAADGDPDAEAFKVNMETPDSVTYDDIEDPAFIADLEKLTGRSLRIHTTQRGIFDARPVSLFSLSAAAKLGEELGMDIDKRRFRANFYVEWDNQDDPFYELSLVGKTLKIGEWLEVAIVERDPRCTMITLDPDTAEETPKLLQHLARKHSGDAGVFAAVLQRGRVNKGDRIILK